MTALYAILLLVALQRLAELIYARRNERRLRAEGAVEVGAGHYPFLVLLHAGWLLALLLLVPAETPPVIGWLLAFLVLQAARIWVIVSLGRYWTTRVLTLPNAPLVRHGPYRWMRHPNYLVVAGEIAVLPLCFGAWEIALVFSLLNAVILARRIGLEEATLMPRRRLKPSRYDPVGGGLP